MLENTYSVERLGKNTIIRGRSLKEFEQLIGPECMDLLNFLIQYGAKVSETNGMLEIVIPSDSPVGADSIVSKIYHSKRVHRTQQDKMWKGAI